MRIRAVLDLESFRYGCRRLYMSLYMNCLLCCMGNSYINSYIIDDSHTGMTLVHKYRYHRVPEIP